MRLFNSICIHGLVGITSFIATTLASSRQGLIYTLDQTSQAQSQSPETVSLDTARLILDRRLGIHLEDPLGDVTEATLDKLNRYGGVQRPLLTSSSNTEQTRKVLIALEGYDFEGKGAANFDHIPTIKIQDVGNEDLFNGMLDGSQLELHSHPVEIQVKKDMSDADISKWFQTEETIFHATFPKNSNDNISKFLSVIYTNAVQKANAGVQETTVLILPTPLNKPHRSARKSNPLIHARRLPEEELLNTEGSSTSVSPAQASSNSSYKILPPNLQIPRCFASSDACQSETNGCSSHGSCVLLHSPNVGDDNAATDCWSCSCKATTSSSGAVTHWGGNACQKMDISVPFWLFAGFGVTMTALIAGGIGMMWSMGNQELPGVLGAGVGGPRAQR